MGSGLEETAPASSLLAEGRLSALPDAELTSAGTGAELDRDWLAVSASAVGLIFSAGTLALYSFGVFVRPLTAEFGWSRTGLFVALSFYNFGLAFCSPIWGAVRGGRLRRDTVSLWISGASADCYGVVPLAGRCAGRA